ncbi:carbamoyl phosphate synthase small subunit [Niallia sp. XMNu-256]|uniref:carbamoyl phosphate synthase small subunit n=1 Tax=Niallia sp. XMNu-256 TaxID=3082444 RepID=UPI0030D535FE
MEGYLQLKCGDRFKGKWLTNVPEKTIKGEIVFFTGMTGYQEVLTDPSYRGKIVVFTYPLIGNYGINEADFESKKSHVAGVVVYEAKEVSFHYEAKKSLKEYLQKWGVPMLGHIDTRAVVKKIRSIGTMPAVLSKSSEVEENEFILPAEGKVEQVTSTINKTVGMGKHHIVLLDFGSKKSIVENLVKRDCKVTTVPSNITYEAINQLKPDGILLSNGPGNPKELEYALPTIKKLIQLYPTLGISLGHQVAALALGADTVKLTSGHHGAYPIIDLDTNKVLMSSQSHSYVVDKESVKGTGLVLRYTNLHDHSVEGFIHETYPLHTVQFNPESHPGPLESNYVFDEFIETVKANNGRVYAYA